jgi:predicted dehydrogenase
VTVTGNDGASVDVLRLGLVGCGRLAERGYVPAIAGLDGVDLAAVVDPDRDRRRGVAALAAPESSRGAISTTRRETAAGGIRRRVAVPPRQHERLDALLGAGRIDAVVIASPPAHHLADAELAAAAGLPCLVEKPPAPDLAGAERLAELDPAPWIGFNRRFSHGRELIDSVPAEGELELALEIRYRRASWRALAVSDDALVDLGPHLVDLALLLTGSDGAEVRMVTTSPARAELEIETARGPATIRCANDRAHRERVVIRRRDGDAVAISDTGGLARALAGRLRRGEHPLVLSLRRQLAAFAAAARGGDPGLLSTAEDGARAMRVIAAAGDAAASREPAVAGRPPGIAA